MKWIFNRKREEETPDGKPPDEIIPDEIIIGRKLYNVKQSTLIYEETHGYYCGFPLKSRTWYFRTKKGNYFEFEEITRHGFAVTEGEIKEILLINDLTKYRELFGEPEEA